ncbi:MAG: hypothetical protein M5F18_05805 [Asgard group archaeon]|nr:hypothetical protein [Asgard group archaeon]
MFATDFLCAEFFSLVLKFAEEIVSLSSLLFCTDSLLALKQQQKNFFSWWRAREWHKKKKKRREREQEETREKREEREKEKEKREERERNTRENRNKTIKIHVTEKNKK